MRPKRPVSLFIMGAGGGTRPVGHTNHRGWEGIQYLMCRDWSTEMAVWTSVDVHKGALT